MTAAGAVATSEVLLVGEDNPYGDDPRLALYHKPRHASGNRLRQHLGLRDATYERLAKVNLCMDTWATREARIRAGVLCNSTYYPHLRVVILLGAKVRDAFGFKTAEFFGVVREPGVIPVFVVLPHPSGRNLNWNQAGAREEARVILKTVAPQVPWGEVAE